MAKIIPITVNRKQPTVVTNEKLTYELPEVLQALIEDVNIQPIYAAREFLDSISEEVLAAAIGQALEEVDAATDSHVLSFTDRNILDQLVDVVSLQSNVSLIENVAQLIEEVRLGGSYDIQEVISEITEEVVAAALADAKETVELISDSFLLDANLEETVFAANDTYSLNFNSDDVVDVLTDSNALNFNAYDTIFLLLDKQAVSVGTDEAANELLDNNLVVGTAIENTSVNLEPTEIAVGSAIENTSISTTESNVTNASLAMYANAVNSNTNWATSTNALGNTTNTSAILSATSSNLGVTNNTTTGTLIVGFRDQTLTDLTVSGQIILSVELSAAINGVILNTQPTVNVTFAYSFDGTNFTTIRAVTAATAKQIFTVNLTSAIGTDYTKINSLVVRATGSVTSGTGLGSNSNVQFYRTFLTASFTKTY